jgi:thiaminase
MKAEVVASVLGDSHPFVLEIAKENLSPYRFEFYADPNPLGDLYLVRVYSRFGDYSKQSNIALWDGEFEAFATNFNSLCAIIDKLDAVAQVDSDFAYKRYVSSTKMMTEVLKHCRKISEISV